MLALRLLACGLWDVHILLDQRDCNQRPVRVCVCVADVLALWLLSSRLWSMHILVDQGHQDRRSVRTCDLLAAWFLGRKLCAVPFDLSWYVLVSVRVIVIRSWLSLPRCHAFVPRAAVSDKH